MAPTWLTGTATTEETRPRATPICPRAVDAASRLTAANHTRLPERWMCTTATSTAVAGSTRLQPATQV